VTKVYWLALKGVGHLPLLCIYQMHWVNSCNICAMMTAL